MLSYHTVVLTLPSQYIGVAMLMLFVMAIYHKIFSFNKFMREHVHLGDMYKKNPEKAQEEYDSKIEVKIKLVMAKEDKIFQKKKRKLGDNAESLQSPASKEQLLEIYKIKDLGQL